LVKFGTFTLPHVLMVSRKVEKIFVEKPIPGQSKARRVRSGGRGYIIDVKGEVRWTTAAPTEHTTLISLCDGVSRTFDLEDGSPSFTAVMSEISLEQLVEAPKTLRYEATFMEQNNPS
jgi:hypothetical protein